MEVRVQLLQTWSYGQITFMLSPQRESHELNTSHQALCQGRMLRAIDDNDTHWQAEMLKQMLKLGLNLTDL